MAASPEFTPPHAPFSERGRLVRDGAFGTGMRGYSLLIGLVSTFVTIRFLGADDYGVYTTSLLFYKAMATLATWGLGQTLIPSITRALDAGSEGGIAGLIRFGVRTTLLTACLLSVLTLALSGTLTEKLGLSDRFPPVLALILLAGAVTAVRDILFARLRGIGRVAVVFTLTRGLRPTALVVMLGGLLLLGALLPTLPRLMSLVIAIVVLDTGVLWVTWRWFRPDAPAEPLDSTLKRRLVSVTYPVTLQRVKDVAQTSTGRILVAVLTQRIADVGFLTLAQKLAGLVGFPRQMLASSYGPIASELHVEGRYEALAEAYRLTALLGLIGASGLGLALGLWAPSVLPVFGKGFDLTYAPLIVIAASTLVGVLLGPAQATLVMTERTRVLGVLAPLEFGLNLGLGLLWIPDLGLLGAVYAGVASAQLRHLGLTSFLFWRTGIHSFGAPLIGWLVAMLGVGAGAWAITKALPGVPGAVVATLLGAAWFLPHVRYILRRHGLSPRELIRLPAGLRQARTPHGRPSDDPKEKAPEA